MREMKIKLVRIRQFLSNRLKISKLFLSWFCKLLHCIGRFEFLFPYLKPIYLLTFRARMIKVGLLPKLVLLMKKCSEDPVQHPRSANLQNSVVCVLYHLSIEDKVKSMFAYTDCIPLVMKMVLETVEDQVHNLMILQNYQTHTH